MNPGSNHSRTRRADVRRRRYVALLLAAATLAGMGVLHLLRPDPVPAENVAPRFVLHAEPRRLAPITFMDGTGQSLSLERFQGKVILLNIWATWCPPCLKEMPALDRLQGQLGGKDFEVVALSIDKGAEGIGLVRSFYASLGLHRLGIYHDPEGVAGFDLGVMGVPATLLLDRQGRELGRMSGVAAWDGPESVALMRRYIAGEGAR